jgi:hypothetical protein
MISLRFTLLSKDAGVSHPRRLRHCEERSNPDYTGRRIASFPAMAAGCQQKILPICIVLILLIITFALEMQNGDCNLNTT